MSLYLYKDIYIDIVLERHGLDTERQLFWLGLNINDNV